MSLRTCLPALCFGLSLTPALALGQSTDRTSQAKPQPRQIVLSADPVTGDEARQIFLKVETAFRKVMPTIARGGRSRLGGARPVTRAAIVGEMDRLFQLTKPTFKLSPKRIPVDPARLAVTDSNARSKMATLIAWGCVEASSALASAQRDAFGVLEFGDAIGVFVKRISELSHAPSDRYSPDRMRPSDLNDPNAGLDKRGG